MASSVALLDHMVDYCLEEDKCLHNVLLHYFSDRAALPTGCCGGCCGNCMRRLGMPGAPPTRAQLAAAAKANAKGGAAAGGGFVKASTLVGKGGGKGAGGSGKGGRGKAAKPRGKKQQQANFARAAPGGQAAAQAPQPAPPAAAVAAEQHRATMLSARAKQMQQASVVAQGNQRVAQMQQRQAVQVHRGNDSPL